MVIAVVNSKGGVGKTTTAVNLGAALACPRRRVLLVDLDSQASASRWCGVDRARLEPSAAACLLGSFPVAQAVRQTATPELDLLTGSIELANADVALCDRTGRELALRNMLQRVRSTYDVVLLDCSPGMSLLTVNALVAADALIVPVVPRFLPVDNLDGLHASFEMVRTRLATRIRLLGLLLVMIGSRGRDEMELRRRVRAEYRDRVFQTEIPQSRQLEAAAAASRPVLSFAPRSRAAHAFRRLAAEVLERARYAKRP